ncbi:perforin-1-like [Polymixia lowei]
MVRFHGVIIESILSSSITVWFGASTARDKGKLQRFIQSAKRVTGCNLPAIQDPHDSRTRKPAGRIIVGPLTPPWSPHLPKTLSACQGQILTPFENLVSQSSGAHEQATCTTLTQRTNQECTSTPFIPGHALSARGFDLVRMQATTGLVLDAQSFLTPTNSCNLCENPLMGGGLQKLPLIMSAWRSESGCDPLSSSVHPSVGSLVGGLASSAVGSDWENDLGLEGLTSKQLAGTRSTEAHYALSRVRSDKTLFSSHQLSCSKYNYSLYDVPLLHSDFNQQMLSLPKNLTSATLPAYQRFINTYGTHYVIQGQLGGRLTRVTSVRQCLASINKVSVYTVRDCVKTGLSVGLGLINSSALSSRCRAVLSNRDTVTGYSQGFLDHVTVVTNGNGWLGEISTTINDSLGFRSWQDSLTANPGLVSYSLRPLDSLVPDPNISANLRSVVRQYIAQNGIIKNPSQPHCRRPNLSSQCCPVQIRRGRMEVTAIRAWGLKGDPVGRTEGYVKIWYGGSYRRTRWIRSNSPRWNAYYDFGNMNTGHRLRLEVWDKDLRYDDRLGGCSLYPRNGGFYHTCGLNRGGFAFSYRLTCDNHLTGSKCHLYRPSLR